MNYKQIRKRIADNINASFATSEDNSALKAFNLRDAGIYANLAYRQAIFDSGYMINERFINLDAINGFMYAIDTDGKQRLTQFMYNEKILTRRDVEYMFKTYGQDWRSHEGDPIIAVIENTMEAEGVTGDLYNYELPDRHVIIRLYPKPVNQAKEDALKEAMALYNRRAQIATPLYNASQAVADVVITWVDTTAVTGETITYTIDMATDSDFTTIEDTDTKATGVQTATLTAVADGAKYLRIKTIFTSPRGVYYSYSDTVQIWVDVP